MPSDAIPDSLADLIFTKYLVTKIGYQKFSRIDKYPYPKEAIREAVFKAIVHRKYATHIPTQIRAYRDKLIISNSCILPYGWIVESMPEQHTSKSYNPLIANVFLEQAILNLEVAEFKIFIKILC